MKTIGITTTVPIEVLLAAGYKVIDLNNIFITSDNYGEFIDLAEKEGFPKAPVHGLREFMVFVLKTILRKLLELLREIVPHLGHSLRL